MPSRAFGPVCEMRSGVEFDAGIERQGALCIGISGLKRASDRGVIDDAVVKRRLSAPRVDLSPAGPPACRSRKPASRRPTQGGIDFRSPARMSSSGGKADGPVSSMTSTATGRRRPNRMIGPKIRVAAHADISSLRMGAHDHRCRP